MDKLPVYQLMIDENPESEFEVNVVSLVEKPAIEKNFLAFTEAKALQFAVVSDEKRIVVGPAMIPDSPIYRNDEAGEYYVTFSKETVEQIALKFYQKNFHHNANMQHNPNAAADGVTYFQSFIKDTEKGIPGMTGDFPEGTWFLAAKIQNDEVWNQVKAGTIKGFSVEGMFKYKAPKASPEQVYAQIKELLKNLEA